jgi:diacylglycerol kinase family enzyme
MKIDFISIIYNPKSSGASNRLAQELYTQIVKKMPGAGIEVNPTKYAGHAVDITEITGRTRRNAVIISIGGDGTYNEVVNGALRLPARQRPTLVTVPAGNANDHASEVGEDQGIVDRLLRAKTQPLDALKVSVHNPAGQDILRFAHSYVGFGASGRVASRMERHNPGKLVEKIVVLREILRPQQFELVADGRFKYLYSLVAANIGRMAKHLAISDDADPADGQFEVVETPAISRMQLLKEVAGSVLTGESQPKKADRYSFLLMSNVQAQFDGEPEWLPRGATVTITIQPKAFKTLV